MNDLVTLKKNDIFTDSMVVAEGTDKKHPSIQKLLNNHKNDFEEFGKLRFEIRPSDKGQNQKIYLLNEQQATLLITYLGNNEAVRKFKIRLVQEFFRMRQILMQKQTESWEQSRTQGMLTRKSETDVIKELVDHAKSQGSKNSEKLYMIYSKLANNSIGVSNREAATVSELNNLALVENIILHVIREGIILNKHYKEIYQNCKNRLTEFNEIAYIGA